MTSTCSSFHLYDKFYNATKLAFDPRHYSLSLKLYSILWKELGINRMVLYTHLELVELFIGLAVAKNYYSGFGDLALFKFKNTPLSALSEFEYLSVRELEMILRKEMFTPLTSVYPPIEE